MENKKRHIMLLSPKDNNFFNFRSELILKLIDLGHKVTLVCPYGKKIDYFTNQGCYFYNLNMDRRGKSIVADLKLTYEYYKLIKKEQPDIVLTYTTKCSVYAGWVCNLLSIPYIVNNAGLMELSEKQYVLKLVLNFLYKIGFSGAACMMYQNSRERNYINSLLSNKVYYRDIPGSGVNLNKFTFKSYPPIDDDKIIFNFVARIVDIKGINEYLKCAEIIKKKYPNCEFRIFGDYDDLKYKDIIKQYVDEKIIKYYGVQMDMKPYIEEAHAVIHPSYYEGMTNVVLEHSAMGRPCIGSNISGVKEGIDHGITGYLFQVKNIKSLVDAVIDFIELDYDEKVNMGKKARLKMEKEFNRDYVSNIYIEEIFKILNNGEK